MCDGVGPLFVSGFWWGVQLIVVHPDRFCIDTHAIDGLVLGAIIKKRSVASYASLACSGLEALMPMAATAATNCSTPQTINAACHPASTFSPYSLAKYPNTMG